MIRRNETETRNMKRVSRYGWAIALLMTAACSVPVVSDRDQDVADTGSPDGAANLEGGASEDGQVCDPKDGDVSCPDGWFCDANSSLCVECLVNVVRCSETGKRERCDKPQLTDAGVLSGGFFYDDPCDETAVCVESAGEKTTCVERICEPLERRCVDPLRTEVCDAKGIQWEVQECFAGKACYEGSCEKVRHNALIIFDTSGSMHQYIDMGVYPEFCDDVGLPCLAPWPDCDSPEAPLTAMTLAKKVFSQEIKAAVEGHVQFALQRFPQREALGQQPHCAYGLYKPSSTIAGDDDSWDTSQNLWFEAGLNEALVVPFPKRVDGDNAADLVSWMNHKEQVGATD